MFYIKEKKDVNIYSRVNLLQDYLNITIIKYHNEVSETKQKLNNFIHKLERLGFEKK